LPDLRTTVTELATGLGILGYSSIHEAVRALPYEMVGVAPETWEILELAIEGGALAAEFEAAWNNGQAFLLARDALRGRRPLTIEWKGGQKPSDEAAPIDLRVDHVYLVSCKV
jgi:hypothetical protein